MKVKKAKKSILLALEDAKKEILSAIEGKRKSSSEEKTPAKKKRKAPSRFQEHFEALSMMLSESVQPSRFRVMTIVAPLADALEKEPGLEDGLFDILSPEARKSAIMLFLFHMLKQADEDVTAKPPQFPDRVPLDISDGDNIPQEVVDGQVPYKRRPRGKLDKGF